MSTIRLAFFAIRVSSVQLAGMQHFRRVPFAAPFPAGGESNGDTISRPPDRAGVRIASLATYAEANSSCHRRRYQRARSRGPGPAPALWAELSHRAGSFGRGGPGHLPAAD